MASRLVGPGRNVWIVPCLIVVACGTGVGGLANDIVNLTRVHTYIVACDTVGAPEFHKVILVKVLVVFAGIVVFDDFWVAFTAD